MTHRRRAVSLVIVFVVLVAATTPVTGLEWLSNSARFNFRVSPPLPLDQLPEFEVFMVVPRNLVPSEQSSTEIVCNFHVDKNDRPIQNAKGVWRGGVMVRDNATGRVESTRVANGRFRTGGDGERLLRFSIPVAVFADGFESGEVSVWSYVEGELTNRKKATYFWVHCTHSVRRD